jgi:hypothetical protein
MEAQKDQIMAWRTLNLCIGVVFDLINTGKEFSTGDVAKILKRHGVEVQKQESATPTPSS